MWGGYLMRYGGANLRTNSVVSNMAKSQRIGDRKLPRRAGRRAIFSIARVTSLHQPNTDWGGEYFARAGFFSWESSF